MCPCGARHFLPFHWSLAIPRSLDGWSNSTLGLQLEAWRLNWWMLFKAPPSSLSPSSPSFFLMPPCKVVITTQSTEGDFAHHTSTVMCALVVFAGIHSLSFMGRGCPRLTPFPQCSFYSARAPFFALHIIAGLRNRRQGTPISTLPTRLSFPGGRSLIQRRASTESTLMRAKVLRRHTCHYCRRERWAVRGFGFWPTRVRLSR